MAVSGSINYGATAHSIITEALELIGAIGEGESPNQDQIDSCLRTLNMMVKSWQNKKAHLFTLQQQFLFPKKDQREYSLSSTTSDNFTADYVQTELAAAALSGATSIEVDSITGMATADYIGVEVANNVVHWTTINGAPSGSTVVLTDGLSAAAAVDGTVFAYTTKAGRPMKIYEAVERSKDIIDIPLQILPYEKYQDLSNKTTDGRINQLYYNPQVSAGELFVWPEPDVETSAIVMWAQRTLDDFDAVTDDVAFPQEWFLALSYSLARYISPKYGTPDSIYTRVLRDSVILLEDAETWDSEGQLEFEPDTQMRTS